MSARQINTEETYKEEHAEFDIVTPPTQRTIAVIQASGQRGRAPRCGMRLTSI
jgi:hypothetical protein